MRQVIKKIRFLEKGIQMGSIQPELLFSYSGEYYFGFQPYYTSIHRAWYKNFKP